MNQERRKLISVSRSPLTMLILRNRLIASPLKHYHHIVVCCSELLSETSKEKLAMGENQSMLNSRPRIPKRRTRQSQSQFSNVNLSIVASAKIPVESKATPLGSHRRSINTPSLSVAAQDMHELRSLEPKAIDKIEEIYNLRMEGILEKKSLLGLFSKSR